MARYRPEHKEQTRQRLVKSAVSMLRRDGVDAAGLKEIMQQLGMTVGGFYRHFPSKSALVQAAVAQGLAQSLDRMQADSSEDGQESISQFSKFYLSDAHRRSLTEGCVLAALSSDIARGDTAVKRVCEEGLRKIHKDISARLPDDAADVRNQVWAIVALEVGGLLLSRMVERDKTAAEILDSCQLAVRQLVESRPPRARRRARKATKARTRRLPVRPQRTTDG